MVPPFILFLLLFSQPESPRWHLQQAFKRAKSQEAPLHFEKAYESLKKLRSNHLETGRDFFDLWYRLKNENNRTGASSGRRRILDLLIKPRCRHAFCAGMVLMLLQQFCGVNILAYYSSPVYKSAWASDKEALGVSSAGFCAQHSSRGSILTSQSSLLGSAR